MSEEMNKLTVLMSVYNDGKYLVHSVGSILKQTHREFEFLIIDDGSKEDIEKIISGFSDPRIVYKRIEHKGLAGALNYGMNSASGDLIARIDADDISVPERLELQMKFMISNPDVDVTSSESVYINDKMKILFVLKPPGDNESLSRMMNLHNPLNHSAVIFRKEKILEAGGYNESFDCYEDFELWFRMRSKFKFAVMQEVLVFTRLRTDSMTGTQNSNKIHELLAENAKQNLAKSTEGDEKKFWHNILFRIEYFYGDKDRARKYFPAEFKVSNLAAYAATLLPGKLFDRIISSRIKYRLQMNFSDKRKFAQQLKKIINPE